MKNVIAWFVVASLCAVGACKKGGAEAGAGDVISTVAAYKDKMCACKDKDCATKVNGEYGKWLSEMGTKLKGQKDIKPDEATEKRMTEIANAFMDCMGKAMGAAGPGQ